jgi:hypothetical protein
LPETASRVSDAIIHRGTIQKVMVFTAQEFTAQFIAIQLCGYVLYILKILCYIPVQRHVVAQLVEALRYKPEGCGFNSQ